MQILFVLIVYFTNEVTCEEKPIKSKNLLPYFKRQVVENTGGIPIQQKKINDTHSDVISSEVTSEEKPIKSKNLLPYFRRQVEENSGDLPIQQNNTDDTHSDIISVLIKNVKEIFNELDEVDTEVSTTVNVTESTIYPINHTSSSPTVSNGEGFKQTKSRGLINDSSIVTVENSIDKESIPIDIETVSDEMSNNPTKLTEPDSGTIEMTTEEELTSYNNFTLVSISVNEIVQMDHATKAYYGLIKNEELRDLSKIFLFETDPLKQEPIPEVVTKANASMFNFGYSEKSRSCINCNNVDTENCNNPKNRLIPSMVCENDDDLCYSMHTPFGVIDRGCFNINNNLTTYVCTCNLCNYITLSEMPYIFSTKQDWIDNVIEISSSRNFRHSVMKEMSCLKCEANASARSPNALDVSNCLAGSIEHLPTEFCDYNEVCAVKVIRKHGYVWRGCIKFPSFNYWWTLCNFDLCNYDPVVSIYGSD